MGKEKDFENEPKNNRVFHWGTDSPQRFATRRKIFHDFYNVIVKEILDNAHVETCECSSGRELAVTIMPENHVWYEVDRRIGHFVLEIFPHCSSILISGNSFVHENWRKKGVGSLMQKMKVFIANQVNASMLTATVQVGNKAEERLLIKHDWKQRVKFFNNQTGNDVAIWDLKDFPGWTGEEWYDNMGVIRT